MVKVAAVGYGAFGGFVLGSISKIPNVEIYGVSGVNTEKLKIFAQSMNIPNWTTDWQTLISDPEVDVVLVLTPPDSHHSIAVAAAKNKKHLFIEKPLALSLKQADEIISEVEKAGVKAVVDYIMRYHQLYYKLKNCIKENPDMGKIKKVWFYNFASSEGLGPDHWFWKEEKSGGVLVEHGGHFYDLFSWLLEDTPEPVATFGHDPYEDMSIVYFPQIDAYGEFYHCFDKPGLLEKNFGGIAFEKGYITFEGWLPLSFKLEKIEEGQVITKEYKLKREKNEVFSELVQKAFQDLLKAIENPQHEVSTSLYIARKALEISLKAKSLKRISLYKE